MKQITTLLLLILLFVGCSDDNEPAGRVTVVVNKDGIPQSGAQIRFIDDIKTGGLRYQGNGKLIDVYSHTVITLPKDWPISTTNKNGSCKINPLHKEYLLLIDLGEEYKMHYIESDTTLITVNF